MRIVNLKDHKKVPVFKNINYAVKMIWQADKMLLSGYILNRTAENIFSLFIQNILFL